MLLKCNKEDKQWWEEVGRRTYYILSFWWHEEISLLHDCLKDILFMYENNLGINFVRYHETFQISPVGFAALHAD